MRQKRPLKNFLTIFFPLFIFITGCGDSGTEQPETPTTTGLVEQSNTGKQTSLEIKTTPALKTAAIKIKPAPLAKLPIADVTVNPASNLTLDDVVQRANQLVPLLHRLRKALDRSQFDLIALNRKLEFDGTSIVDFVRDSVFFEQYVGVLRGAEGTLLGRAGNALDQSLLLTTLLDDAGYESRIAHSTLTTAQAAKLVNQMAQERPGLPTAGDETVLEKILDEIMLLQGFSEEQLGQLNTLVPDNAYLSSTESDTHFIIDALDQAGVTLGDPKAMGELIEEARNYYWVEYRLNAFDEWQTAHPAFATAPDLVAEETFVEPPAALYHRIKFETFIEQKIDDQLVVHPIVSDWKSTTADLVGRPFTYKNQPNNLDFETVGDLTNLLSKTSIFYPVVNERLAGNSFDLDGQYFTPDLLAIDKMGAIQLNQTKAKQLGQAGGTISNLGKSVANKAPTADVSTLTAQWLEYTVTTPKAEDKTYRRYVLDRIGVENRAAGIAEITNQTGLHTLAQSLLTNYSIMVIPNRYSKAYALERYATRSLQEVALINKVIENPTVESLSKLDLPTLKPGQDVILATAFDSGFLLSPKLQTYRSEATVVVYEEGIIPSSTAETLFERVDIVHNERLTFAQGKKLKSDPDAAVRAGVWETYAERAPLRKIGVEFNTAVGFHSAAAQDISLQVLSPADVASVDELNHSALTKSNLKELLDQGYAIIVPSEPLQGQSDTIWWRIDLDTGNALGMATGGYGIAGTEYSIMQIVGFSMAAASMGHCIGSTGNASCCLLAGASMFVLGQFVVFMRSASFALGVSFFASPAFVGVGGLMCSD